MLLATLTVPQNATTIVTGDITDERVRAAFATYLFDETLVSTGIALLVPGAPTNPSVSLGTARRPNATRPTFVTAEIEIAAASGAGGVEQTAQVAVGPTSSPSDYVAWAEATAASSNVYVAQTVSFWVPANYYYEISGGGNVAVGNVSETTF